MCWNRYIEDEQRVSDGTAAPAVSRQPLPNQRPLEVPSVLAPEIEDVVCVPA